MPRRNLLLAGLLLASACASPARKAPPPPAAEIPSDPEKLLPAVREAYDAGQYARGLALVKRLVEVSPDKVTAYDRIGSTYFALGRQEEALGMWDSALAMERDPKRKADLAASVALARRSLGLPDAPAEAGKPPPRPPKRKKTQKPVDPAEVEKLYRQGVARYANSEYMAATTLFMQVLVLDPKHEGARKAMERLKLKPAP